MYFVILKKIFTSMFVFLIVFAIIFAAADVYYYGRVIQKHNPTQICFSDFRVYWFAAHNLGYHLTSPFWFFNSKLRSQTTPVAPPGKYVVYDKTYKFYHYRYPPSVAFAMIPLGKLSHQGHALAIWYVISSIALLLALLLIKRQFKLDFGIPRDWQYIILWGVFFGSLRFYLMNIALGQTDIIVAFLFVLFLMAYIKDKEILCGLLFALILQFKLFFLPMGLYFLIIGKRKLVLSTIMGFLLFLFIPVCMLRLGKTLSLIQDWTEVLRLTLPSQILNNKNQSIVYAMGNLLFKADFVKRIFVLPKYLLYSLSAMFTVSIYITMARFRKYMYYRDEKKYKYLEISLLIIASLLFSPITWISHFVSISVPLAIAIYFTLNSPKRKILYIMVGFYFVLSGMMGTDLTKFLPVVNDLHWINIAVGIMFLSFTIIYGYVQSIKAIKA